MAQMSVLPVATQAVNLQEVIEQAVLTNPAVLEMYNNKISREYEVEMAHSGYLPKLDFDAGGGYKRTESDTTRALGESNGITYNNWEARIALRQMLFDGFLTSSEKARQQKRVESAFFELYNLAEETAIQATEAYLNVLLYQTYVEFAKENLKSHEKMYDQIEMRSLLGADDQSSLSQMQGRLQLAFSNVEAERNNLKDKWTEYVRIVGTMPKDKLEEVDDDIALPRSYEEALDYALANHPALARSKADIEQFKLQKRASKSFFYPRIDLELSSNWNNSYNDGALNFGKSNEQAALIRFNYNLYNGGYDKARTEKDQFLRQGADEHLELQRRRVEADVAFAWHTYLSSAKRMKYLESYVKATEETSKSYLQQFQIGERTLLDLLNTENEIFEAKKEYLKVKYQHILAKYRVLTSMGLMLEKNNIKLFTDEYYRADDIDDEYVNDLQEKNLEHNERELAKRNSDDDITEMRFFKMNNNLRPVSAGRRESK